jgi:hypothetical protein
VRWHRWAEGGLGAGGVLSGGAAGPGSSHSFKEIKLAPGETFTAKLQMRLWR